MATRSTVIARYVDDPIGHVPSDFVRSRIATASPAAMALKVMMPRRSPSGIRGLFKYMGSLSGVGGDLTPLHGWSKSALHETVGWMLCNGGRYPIDSANDLHRSVL